MSIAIKDNCPHPPMKNGTTVNDAASQAQQLLNSMNIGGCSTSSIGAQSDSGWGFSDYVGPQNSSYGCSSTNVLLQSYASTVNSVYCAIQNNEVNYVNTFNNVDTVKIIAGGNVIINCPNFNVFQTADTTINVLNIQKITSKIEDPINRAITSGILDWLPAQKSAAVADGSDPNKTDASINQVQENINKDEFDDESSSQLNQMSNASQDGTTLTISAGGNLTIEGDSCTITQNSLVVAAVKNAVADAFVRALKGVDLSTLFPPPLPIKQTGHGGMAFWLIVIGVITVVAVLVYMFIIKKKAKPLAFNFY